MYFPEIRLWRCAGPRTELESTGSVWEVSSEETKLLAQQTTHISGMIYARAHLGHPRRVESVKHFRSQFDEHKVVLTADTLPYKTTFFLPILEVCKINMVPYRHPRGAIAIVRFRPLSGLPDGSAEVQR